MVYLRPFDGGGVVVRGLLDLSRHVAPYLLIRLHWQTIHVLKTVQSNIRDPSCNHHPDFSTNDILTSEGFGRESLTRARRSARLPPYSKLSRDTVRRSQQANELDKFPSCCRFQGRCPQRHFIAIACPSWNLTLALHIIAPDNSVSLSVTGGPAHGLIYPECPLWPSVHVARCPSVRLRRRSENVLITTEVTIPGPSCGHHPRYLTNDILTSESSGRQSITTARRRPTFPLAAPLASDILGGSLQANELDKFLSCCR